MARQTEFAGWKGGVESEIDRRSTWLTPEIRTKARELLSRRTLNDECYEWIRELSDPRRASAEELAAEALLTCSVAHFLRPPHRGRTRRGRPRSYAEHWTIFRLAELFREGAGSTKTRLISIFMQLVFPGPQWNEGSIDVILHATRRR